MGKCIKSIALSVMAAVFALVALSGPVFATPDTGNGNSENTETVDVADPSDPTSSEEEPTEENNETTDNESETEEETSSSVSCYDQVGSLGWIICPGAGLFGTIIDGAYDLLTQIIEVNPIPTDTESPIYIVWKYFKDITNGLFVVFFLIIIFSQLTGVGINNYGIKKTLPRIIIAAILVNLSYIICTIAVDLSNILGNAFQDFFVNIQNIAIENGTISSSAAEAASVSAIVATLLGIGTAAGAVFVAATAYGSVTGIIWVLLPVLLSGLIAVISAVITMAARQALIFLLVMISPLALIAYMLPNTEKWYQKWYHMLAQMLFFYPMFSILYGASQLAGLVIITSATNWLGIVLGVAVKILPLFMSIPLMRMSGTILGKIDGLVHRATSPAVGAVSNYSTSRRLAAKERALRKQNPILPSTRLAQYLDRRRALREADTTEDAALNKMRNEAYVREKWRRRDGTLGRRGMHHITNEQDKMKYSTIITNADLDIDEGFKDDGTDKRVRNRDLKKLRTINSRYDDLIVDDTVAEARSRAVAHNNMKHRAELIHENVTKESSAIHQRVLDTFNVDSATFSELKKKDSAYNAAAAKVTKNKGSTSSLTSQELAAYNAGPLTGTEKTIFDAGSQAINYTMANAISSRRKLDKEASSIYYELYDDSPAGTVPGDALTASFENGDYNSMNAAIQVMAKRGDFKDIMGILYENSDKLVEQNGVEDQRKIRFQKELNDACLALKSADQVAWAWAKANMIRRGKYNGAKANNKTPTLAAFIDFASFINGSTVDGDNIKDSHGNFIDKKAEEDFNMVDMQSILTNVSDGKIFGDADRTMYNYFTKAGEDGNIDSKYYYFTAVKHLRASASCGKMDGERLAAFNNYFTMNYSEDGDNELFNKNRGLVYQKLREYFKDMNAAQLTGLKTATLMQFNDALIELDKGMNTQEERNKINAGEYGNKAAVVLDANNRGTTVVNVDGKNIEVSNLLLNLLKNEVAQLNKESAINQRSGMNIAVRKMLGIKTEN